MLYWRTGGICGKLNEAGLAVLSPLERQKHYLTDLLTSSKDERPLLSWLNSSGIL
jgi:hypothetical protein